MNLKKLLSLLLIFCLVFSFAACGSRGVDDDDDDRSTRSSRRVDDDDDDRNDGKKAEDDDNDEKDDSGKKDNKDDEDKKDDDGKDDKVSREEEEESKGIGSVNDPLANFPEGKLPEGYPIDKYPNYKDGKVWMGIRHDEGNYYKYTVAVVYAEEFNTIDKFYADYLKNAADYSDQKTPLGNVYTGILDGFKFNIIISETSEGAVQATIELTEIPSADNVLKSLDRAELPSGYPINDFPIIDGAALYDVSESESDGSVTYTLYLYTDKSIKEIVKFYDEEITDIQDKYKYSDSDGFSISGTSKGYYFSIEGYMETENNVELIKYSIMVDPTED
jgi:hypothetical protein